MRFAHIADTHIRNLKYHFEYREVFKQLYKSLKDSNVDYIVHCGDIAHTKTQISPEFVELCTDFFRNLADIAPTYIILGNHDGNLKNSSRQDAITPIVDAMSHPQLHLLKDAGEVQIDESHTLNVLSVFDEDNWTSPSDPSKVNIALYHGSVLSCSTDIGWIMESVDHNIDIFDEFDFAMLGDIHKAQTLDDAGRIRYCGSTVQQNFGESLDKGYLLWDIEDKDDFTVEHISFVNPKPFITINLTPKGRMPNKLTVPEGARLRLVSSTNISLDKVRRAVQIAKHRFKPEAITFLNRAAGENISVENITNNLGQEDLRDIKVQENLIKEYLKDFQVEEGVMKKVLQLNQKYNSVVEQNEEVSRNVNWSLRGLEWSNLFNYGEGNKINFEKLNGIVGIFGKNFSGKSSIVDSLLYTIYNSTSKPVRRNLNIINQNKDEAVGRVSICVNDKEYVVERNSEKYIKRLKGEETEEAKTDVNFYQQDMLGNKISMNGLSRQDTDKNIRRVFGSIDDFLMTSMSSQLGSLSFINEGSTKRKEILAKFLDLEVFDRKFKMVKEDSQETKGALKKLEGRDYKQEIADTELDIEKSLILTDRNKEGCVRLSQEIGELNEQIQEIQSDIESVPAEIINITSVKRDLSNSTKRSIEIREESARLQESITERNAFYEKIVAFLDTFDLEEVLSKDVLIKDKTKELEEIASKIQRQTEELERNRKKKTRLDEVPCGSEFSHCKFIRDAYEASDLIQICEKRAIEYANQTVFLRNSIDDLDPNTVTKHLERYQQVVDRKNSIASSLTSDQIRLEKNDMELVKNDMEADNLRSKILDYENNKEAIENLEALIVTRNTLVEQRGEKEKEHVECQEQVMMLYKQNGSLEHRLETLKEQKQTMDDLSVEYSAYHLLGTCCHPNGISYDIIKKSLPLINTEIAKILTNIVEFEVFIENDSNKLNIYIKHPKHSPRPLELGSGAEKTIASMAIRLAFLSVSSLPKPDVFILDEPGTALDEENMEGFVRILDMVKNYFKTVVLISHLDALKDCVDSQIIIDKYNGYAHIDM